MKRLEGIASPRQIRGAISDLERLADKAPFISVAAVHVLKNELEPIEAGANRPCILFEERFLLPGSIAYRLGRWWTEVARPGGSKHLIRPLTVCVDWFLGRDAEVFRETCDRYFWEVMVPHLETQLGDLADLFLNTINEAIINYAEYSFRPRPLGRRIAVHVFGTDGELVYAIIRPQGLGQRIFDPLELKQKRAGALGEMRRGWGHTLLMNRALFISFDKAPKGRGMMLVVGPEQSRS